MAPRSGFKSNPRWDRFAQEYAVDLSPMKAAIRAGYSPVSAAGRGAELLKNPRVQVLVQRELDARSFRTGVTADTVLFELLRIARCDVGRAFDADGNLKPLHEMDEDVRRAITVEVETGADGVTTKVKFWPKVEALVMLGKHLRLFSDVTELRIGDLAERIEEGRARVASRQTAGELAVMKPSLTVVPEPS